MPWNENLEGPARAFAETDASPVRAIAGPGTGKTRALIRRVARLLEQGCDPRRILVVTFTRTAAADLFRQVSTLEVDGVARVRAGTLHSLCFLMLARAEVLTTTGRHARPLLSFEERFLIEDLNDLRFGSVRERQSRLRAFEGAWARLQSDEPGWPESEVDRLFQGALLSWLRFHHGLLLGELVPEALRYLRNNPECAERATFDHVLVDEYQDLNRAEQTLIEFLAENGSLAIIGDEDQSIYSFKCAHPEGISLFHERHPGTHDESLVECRRCPQTVVSLANELIRENDRAYDRQLGSGPNNPAGEVHVLQWRDLAEEAAGLAHFISNRIACEAVSPGRILVLCPRRIIGYAIRDALQEQGIAAHSFFHEESLDENPRRIDECQSQAAFALLTLLANPEDRVALRCWLGFGSQSLRVGAYRRLRTHCEETGADPRTVLDALAEGRLTLPYSGQLVERYRRVIELLRSLEGSRSQDLVDALFPAGQDWSEPVRMLASGMDSDFGAHELRETLRVAITQPELPTDVDYVRVMSLHKSKGLTADMVIVADCIEGLIPYIDADLNPGEQERMLQEQRRLFYVAITRTTNTLILSSVVRLPRNLAYAMRVPVRGGTGAYIRTVSSRFLGEMGPALPAARRGSDWLAAFAS